MPRTRHFTLIELLTCVCICTILLSILLPALYGAQGKAQKISCTSNLRQLQYAFMQYAADYGNLLPPYIRNSTYGHAGTNWARYTLPYYVDINVLKCPSSPKAGPKNDSVEELHLYDGNYGWNFDGTQANRGPINVAVSNPSEGYLVFDSGDQCIIYGANHWDNLMEELDLDWDSKGEGANRHRDAVNIAFIDGHCSSRLMWDFLAVPNASYTAPWYIEWDGKILNAGTIPFPSR